ncbi:hypothetical protein ACFL04_02320 [Patescibacteria group bacterium]
MKILFIATTIIIIIVAGYFLFRPESSKPDALSFEQGQAEQASNGNIEDKVINSGCVSNPDPVFTSAFMENDKINEIGPIGAIDGGSHGRSYIGVAEGSQTEVYAPTDATLEAIVYAKRGPDVDYGEYGLWFRASCEVTFLLDHLDRVSDDIFQYAPTEPSESSAVAEYVSISVKAGELIGYTDGTELARTYDFLLLNTAKLASYINPARWNWDQNTVADCPYDYYTDELKSFYYSKLRQPNADDGNCGNPSYDVAGTAAGGWFQDNDTDTNGRWLTFGTYTSFVGLAIRQDGARDFSVRDYDNILKPEDMKTGDEQCIAYNDNWAYAKLVNENQLDVATGAGACPSVYPNIESWTR